MRASERNDSNLSLRHGLVHRRGNQRAGLVKFAAQAFHVSLVILRTLAVICLRIVTAATSEVRRCWMLRSGQRALDHTLAVYIFVARAPTQSAEVFFRQ